MWGCSVYQHEIDVEVEDLVAHIHTEVVAEVIPEVGEGPSRTLEVCAGHLHPLDGRRGEGKKRAWK